MCTPSGGWTKHATLYNPGQSPVILREYQHEVSTSKLDVRGGYKAADHIDILGNWEMTVRKLFRYRTRLYFFNFNIQLDVLLIVSGKAENVTERIYSTIEEHAKKVRLT